MVIHQSYQMELSILTSRDLVMFILGSHLLFCFIYKLIGFFNNKIHRTLKKNYVCTCVYNCVAGVCLCNQVCLFVYMKGRDKSMLVIFLNCSTLFFEADL